MRLQFAREETTLLRRVRTRETPDGRSGEVWTPVALKGCFWREAAAERGADGFRTAAPAVVCIVPAGQTAPCPGDMMIRGRAPLPAQMAPAEAMRACRDALPHSFRVTAVADRAAPGLPLPHLEVSGERT